jgi:hypothetical protein
MVAFMRVSVFIDGIDGMLLFAPFFFLLFFFGDK